MTTYLRLENYMTRKQLAEYLNVNPATIHRWKKDLNLPFHKTANGKIVYNLKEVEQWLLNRNN